MPVLFSEEFVRDNAVSAYQAYQYARSQTSFLRIGPTKFDLQRFMLLHILLKNWSRMDVDELFELAQENTVDQLTNGHDAFEGTLLSHGRKVLDWLLDHRALKPLTVAGGLTPEETSKLRDVVNEAALKYIRTRADEDSDGHLDQEYNYREDSEDHWVEPDQNAVTQYARVMSNWVIDFFETDLRWHTNRIFVEEPITPLTKHAVVLTAAWACMLWTSSFNCSSFGVLLTTVNAYGRGLPPWLTVERLTALCKFIFEESQGDRFYQYFLLDSPPLLEKALAILAD